MPGPTQVQSAPNDSRGPASLHGHGHGHDHDHHHEAAANAHAQHLHKEALRMALGSILNPKRPYTPSSRSSSGTASPAYPYSFPHSVSPGTPSIPPPPHSTPSHGRFSDSHMNPFPHHPHPHPHPPLLHSHSHTHVPSRLGQLETHEAEGAEANRSAANSQPNSPTHSTALSKAPSQCPSPLREAAPALPGAIPSDSSPSKGLGRENDHIHAPAPIQGTVVTTTVTSAEGGAGHDKSKLTFVRTLQGKSAWDVLIHGSFS